MIHFGFYELVGLDYNFSIMIHCTLYEWLLEPKIWRVALQLIWPFYYDLF
jgi:hypothetical protein